MLQVLLIALYAIIVREIQRPYIDHIKECATVDEAIRVRKKYRIARGFSILIFVFINLMGTVVVRAVCNDALNFVDLIVTTITSTILAFFLPSGGIFAHKEFNKISFLTSEDARKIKGNFSLLLRGFNTDNYSSIYESSYIKNERFSESTLAKLLVNGSPLYAVGMTKELTCPDGAKRIYLSDEEWKNDVLGLMERATTIYIIVNGNDSCIWEIEQSMRRLNKICFIVDDLAQYEIVKFKLQHKYIMPNFIRIADLNVPFAFRLFPNHTPNKDDDNNPLDSVCAHVFPMENTPKGYAMFINDLYGKKIFKG